MTVPINDSAMNGLAILLGLLLIAVTLFYLRGWARLRQRRVSFANVLRLIAFVFAVTTMALVFLSPLNWLNREYFFIRAAQYVLLCLFTIPAFFISCTFDVALWGLPTSLRKTIVRWMRSRTLVRRTVHNVTRPWIIFFLFIALFATWYDARVSTWLLSNALLHTVSLLVLGVGAMLTWWHLIGTGPRLHWELSPWLAALAIIVLELVNMSVAVPLAFSTEPVYPHYTMAFNRPDRMFPLTLIDDQSLGGGLLWVGGSAVFLSSIVLILNRLFERHGMNRAEPWPDWDADEKMIMPGLEHRLKK